MRCQKLLRTLLQQRPGVGAVTLRLRAATSTHALLNTIRFEFSYACSEPVLVKMIFYTVNGKPNDSFLTLSA
jgi:hypothetical protein